MRKDGKFTKKDCGKRMRIQCSKEKKKERAKKDFLIDIRKD